MEATNTTSKRARAMSRIQQSLIAAQELGDEKLQVVTQLQEMIDQKTRQLDADFKNLDYGDKEDQALISPSPKDVRSNSPSGYLPSSSNSNIKIIESKADDTGSGSLSSNQSNNGDRANNPSTSAGPSTNTASASTNSADKAWKRSRRARNENSVSRSSSVNSFTNASKTHAMDIDSNINSSSIPTKTNNTASQSISGNSSNSNQISKKQNNNSNKKRKRKSGRTQTNSGGNGGTSTSTANQHQQNNSRTQEDTSPIEETIDPDEPTYCLCDQISFGEMILCDNDLCPIEWFHFSCVSLTTKPKGKWFCPNCRGERPSVMKPKQQFLKELERYNREKEEKT